MSSLSFSQFLFVRLFHVIPCYTIIGTLKGKNKEHDMVVELVSQIKEITHEAEDFIDTYVVSIINQSWRNMIQKVSFRSVDHAFMLHRVAMKI